MSELRPRAGNPRTHSRKQIEQIKKSLQRFGFTNPALIDEEDRIIAGHGRIEAARELGLSEVPTILLGGMSEADVRAYVIADNRLAEKSGWDKNLLAIELRYLSDLEEDYDLTLTGFDLAEVDGLLDVAEIGKELSPDDQLPKAAAMPVTRPGDIWNIGNHRLVCGDALMPETYFSLLGDEKAAMIFADPPYNVRINGHVSGSGRHREFPMASGEMSDFEFKSFLVKVFSLLVRHSRDGSMHYQCMDWSHTEHILEAGSNAYSELKNICVWVKANGGMGSLYRSGHEFIFVFKAGKAPHCNNIELGKNGRFRTNVWTYAGANSFGRTRNSDLAMHPTVKPVAMVSDAILDCSRRGEIVLDPFAGSGTTLVAAQTTKRRGYGIELDPIYCDTIVQRMQARFRITATLAGDGRSFDEVAGARAAQIEEQAA
ncbi:DNA methyltransferase [Sphingomonas sp. Y38-1Y]|uniref:site-specific DNA-methyltransferase n=1 Tax=Sphingomonas sp. Y38-1Y TaxID=3078265 RepID=UPI0028EF41FF|nr:DNA methyltransferase [Sphingomonas sp. Y38-1Y]